MSYLKKQSGALIIGIYDNGKETFYTYGETVRGNNTKPDINAIFEIGNITETFTCLLFADMSVRGIMHNDDQLQKYLPVNVPSPVYQPLICKPMDTNKDQIHGYRDDDNMSVKISPYTCSPDSSFKPQPILLCYLSVHTSGLPDLPFNFHKKNNANPYADYNTEDLYDFLRSYRLTDPIGFDYKHSELGIALLGKAISLNAKKDYESILVESILDSMKMNDTRIILSANQQGRFLNGYDSKGKTAINRTYDVFAPVAGLHSSATDMMKFLSANLTMKKNYYSNILDYTHNARLTPGGIANDELEIAMGWKISRINKEAKPIVWQSGLTGGFSSYIGFVETSHTGVIILSSQSKNVNEIGEQILHFMNPEN
jgi:serine-type D-Ala-D-Ala carboxypeptidase/endopeptidase